jgi:proteasome assembly chaperone (PAC2) family protein
MEEGVTFYRKPHLRKPDFIAAWPGMGNVAMKAASFLRNKLKAEEFAEIEPGDFFPLSGITIRENLVETPLYPRVNFTRGKALPAPKTS